MSKLSILLGIFFHLNIYLTSAQVKQQDIFRDDFKHYENGSIGNPTWHPIKGNWQIINNAYYQLSTEYDCASMLDIYLNESFEMDIEFEHLEGDPGGGFIFASREKGNIEFAQMIRFDGKNVLLAGYFQNGEFNMSSSTKTIDILPNQKHSLTLKVDSEKDNCTIILDDIVILKEAPLKFSTGYVGLQSSAGSVRFHNVVIKKLSMEKKSFKLNWVNHFAITPLHEFIIPDEVTGVIKIIDNKGNLLHKIGTPTASRGQLTKPNSVALLDDTTIIITDRGSNQLHKFSIDGKWKNSIGWKGKELGLFDMPSSITVNSSKQIFVADKNNNRIQVFDDSLRPIAQFGSDKLIEPNDITIKDNSIFILNTGLSQIELYIWNGKKAIWKKSISYGGGEAKGIATWKDKIYISVVNEVRAHDTSGILLHTFRNRCLDFILPQSIVVDNFGNVFISDYFHNRIVQTTPDLLDPDPKVVYPNSSSAIIEWRSLSEEKENISMTAFPITQKQTLKNLIAGQTYQIKLSPTLITIPNTISYTTPKYTITTPRVRKTKLYKRLPIATLIFTNIMDDKNKKPDGQSQPSILASEIERIKNQIADGIKFYWIHSGMRLFLDNETFIIDEPLTRNQVYGPEWWYPPLDSVLEKYLKLNGKHIKNYSGFLYLTCTQQYDTLLHKYVLAGRGGGFTNGVGTGKGFGISWWDVTRANHNAGNNWLMVHEFNHQLDDIFLASGYPEYWFNHISPTIGTAAKFGEHFDANSYILHNVPSEQWYDLKFATLESTRDADEDGIPDYNPNLPLDEIRLDSDSTKNDSDGDGVNDIDELFFSNWITEGWGETYGGTTIFPNLHKVDTDVDGYNDDIDPYPCYSTKPEIKYSSSKDCQMVAQLNDDRIHSTIYSSWSEDSLNIKIEMNNLVPLKLMIDGNADGWFIGQENYLINITPENNLALKTSVQIFNGSDPKRWPFMDQSLSEKVQISSQLINHGSKFIIHIAIPKNEANGFKLQKNRQIGLSFGFLCPIDGDGNKRYINIFEPNRLMYFQLTSKVK